MTTRGHSAYASPITVMLTLVAVTLLTVTTGLCVMQQLEQLGPYVGGIIVFRQDATSFDRWSVTADATGDELAAPGTRHCVLSPNVMVARGGSLVVEARQMSIPPVFRVHWAGGHTENGPEDCGTAADLVIDRRELMRLANAAGGFNSGFRLIGP
jgi:hypothetical protein